MSFFHKNKVEEKIIETDDRYLLNPVRIASIMDIVSSEIFQDILKENGIPCICRQSGAGGCVKIVFGGGFVPDDIYVDETNAERAKELYEAYLNTEVTVLDENGE